MTGPARPDPSAPTDDDAAELIAQLKELAGADPGDVRQVVAEVLAALDRAAGGALREHLPEAIRVDAGLDPAEPVRR
ncbi:hypothetical protein [Micromonospora endolithica]|uniref:Uncharacterized protein n=1 Tax=Micromonospora endolithica TaxID=230091 RepID=A0A3A9ZM00_9ACTN|nr:hypothetical protein [Micromonospora endolithica]RKN48376.1 hypothetical protein D7223_10230 [Micromonospora endolithica]TWJ24554.1 hypothetical protein JD76_04706 [Micromonospora endolithica]